MPVSSDRNDQDYKGDAEFGPAVFQQITDDIERTAFPEIAPFLPAIGAPEPVVDIMSCWGGARTRVAILQSGGIDPNVDSPFVGSFIEPVVWFDRAITDTEAVQLSKFHPSACIDPNAEMIQKDALGSIEQARRDWERADKFIEGMRKALADMQPPEPGESLGIVAPMDHRLGRFKA